MASSEKTVIVSVGAGTSASEVTSDKLCLCLDKDRRALQSGVVNMHRLHKSSIIFAYFTYGKDSLYDLLKLIHSKTGSEIEVLIQYPTLSLTKLAIAAMERVGHHCIDALLEKIIGKINFIFYFEEGRNTWTSCKLREIFMKQIPCSKIEQVGISETQVIADISDNYLIHPVLGKINILGWARMRRGKEVYFSLNLK